MADLGGVKQSEIRPPVPESAGEIGAPESAPETPGAVESAPDVAEQAAERATVEQERVQAAPTPVVTVPPRKDPLLADVERTLEEGLVETYAALPPAVKQQFKAKGEMAAGRIRQMLTVGHLKLREIWKLIRDWLRVIPGASKFFVEQEAKIKTDRIIRIAEKQKRQ